MLRTRRLPARQIAVIPLRSLARGATEKMPMTAVITPMAWMISGKTQLRGHDVR